MSYSLKSRIAASLGAAALVVGSGAVLTAPAQAESAKLKYNCMALSMAPVDLEVSFDTDAPASVDPGVATPVLNGTAKVDVPLNVAQLITGDLVGADTIEGTATLTTVTDGVAQDSVFTIARTPVTAAAFTVNATGPMFAVTGGALGAKHVISADKFRVDLKLFKGGAPAGVAAADLVCTKPAAGDLTIDTIHSGSAPVAVDTTTKVSAKYKKGTITAKVAVTGVTDGTVTVNVKGPKKFKKKVTATVKNGKATVKIKKIKVKGKYTLKASLAASDTNKASAGKATVKVK